MSYDVWADDVINLSPREEGAASANGDSERTASAYGERQTAGALAATHDPGGEDLDELPF